MAYMMLTRKLLYIYFLCFCCAEYASAQSFSRPDYPKNYFTWPVRATRALAANFGELRANHYHMGLDCKTERRENLPILAAASGHISRVKIEKFGFGRAIYIDHPNGLTTVYAHLNDFYPELEKYVTEQQYRLQSWAVSLDIPPGLFPVKQGDFIAYSGNTGGSQGPHLHFEIRDTKTEKVLNPLLFGFPVEDRVPPDVLRLALYDRRLSTYEQSPRIIALSRKAGVYHPASGKILVNSDRVSLAFTAYDRYSGSTNQNGIFAAELWVDGKLMSGFVMDSIGYDETRYLNAHIDHAFRKKGGAYLEHLSLLPGSAKGIYVLGNKPDGIITLEPNQPRKVEVKIYDANGNVSTIQSELIFAGQASSVPEKPGVLFRPGEINVFDRDDISFYLPEQHVYDSFRFVYAKTLGTNGQAVHTLHNPAVPVHGYFPVRIKAGFPLEDTGKVVMKRSFGSSEDYRKATYANSWYTASFREFGRFELMVDKEPPVVTPIGFRDGMNAAGLKRIVFNVTDNSEEIAVFRALLDGRWLRFSNDKGKRFVYTFDEYCIEGPHELRLIVEDQVGNRTEKTYRFTR